MTRIARNSPARDYTSAAIGVGALALLGGAALLGRRGAPSGSAGLIRMAARTMGASILADSAMEHRRGSYHNAAMYAAPALAALSTLLAGKRHRGARLVHAAAIGTGIAGMGFHAWNLLKRPGRISWNNLFYGAPIAAPGGLILTGALALADGPAAAATVGC